MVELKGSLGSIGLTAIVQLIGELHHSGTLQLVKGDTTGRLAFDGGRLVAATCGDEHGLQAIARCALDLSNADFTFIEAAPTVERTLDLGAAELKRLLGRIDSGEFAGVDVESDASNDGLVEHAIEVACPLLGFADDRERHYSRPTALHRCFAGGAPSLVTTHEQRELCLGGDFPACPRFRNAERVKPAGTPRPEPPRLLVEPHAPPPRHVEPGTMPPGVAARMAAASQLHVSPIGSPEGVPPASASDHPASIEPVEAAPSEPKTSRSGRRGLLLVVGGAVLGLALVAIVLGIALPLVRGDTLPKPTAVSAPAFEPVATAGRAATPQPTPAPPTVVAAAAPTGRLTTPPTPAPAAPGARATAQTGAALASDARSLVDVRFASGPAEKWVNNPPFASWSDGAFRFQARQPTQFVAVGVPIPQILTDVVVSATFRKTGGPPGGGYGLMVRDQGPEPRDGVNQDVHAYVFETGDLGEYGVWRRDGDHWVDMVPWTRSATIRPGGSPNELTVRATGDRFAFMVNGSQVALLQDDTYDGGGVALFVGGDYNEVALDHFTVQLPD